MILDNLENSQRYHPLHKNFEKAFRFIKEQDLEKLEIGRYEIDGEDIFALIQEYQTQPAKKGLLESHRNYIDIQYIIEGKEAIAYAPEGSHEIFVPYNAKDDMEFSKLREASLSILDKGDFQIFFTGELHMPGCSLSEDIPVKIKKLVIKVRPLNIVEKL